MFMSTTVFSQIINFFLDLFATMLEEKNLLDEGDDLRVFIGILENRNDKKPLDINYRNQLENFFKYRWDFDKNASILQAGSFYD